MGRRNIIIARSAVAFPLPRAQANEEIFNYDSIARESAESVGGMQWASTLATIFSRSMLP